MSSKLQLRVFTETNLGTRIAVPVSSDITAGEFKGEFMKAHFGCFAELGFLSIKAVMVKWNSYLYHLPDLLPLKHVFLGFQDPWFLYVNANLPKRRKKKRRKRKHTVEELSESCNREICKKESIEPKGSYSSTYEKEQDGQYGAVHLSKVSASEVTAETPGESLSGIVSVSGIIRKYFTNSFDIEHIEDSANSRFTPKTCQRLFPSVLQDKTNSVVVKNKYERSEVGNRLVVASKNSASSQRSTISKGKKLWDPDARSVIRNLVFEVDESD